MKFSVAESGVEIQDTLVPPIVYRSAQLEAYGVSVPKDEVGGDLMDLVADGQNTVACVADVSGHGWRAGVLMGMIKTALRYGLMLGRSMVSVLDDINRVLPGVKTPNMYATLAALRFDGSDLAEYVSAGHVPLLHYRARYRDVVRYSMPQFPLGLFTSANYGSCRIAFEKGDLFVLLTDGVTEADVAVDAEITLAKIERALLDFPHLPLAELMVHLRAPVTDSGSQEDDQTSLIVRAGEPERFQPNPFSELEGRWRDFLDDLEEQLSLD